tara:strand:- start:11141 stop:12340 length:1200 start_codon:yes stop_codon:yes gene_type:complete
MKYIYILFLLFSFLTNAQNSPYINQVLILNEGCYDFYEQEMLEPATIGVYIPENNTYNTIMEIEGATFTTDLIIDGNYFYVAADNKILKFDLDTYELITSQDVPGVRELMIHEDYLIITKGDYDNETFSPVIFDSYLDVFSKIDLSLIMIFDTENGPQWSTESLLKHGDQLYVGINNAYEYGNYKGIVGVLDLNTMSYTNEIDLGEDGKNPISLHIKDDHIYSVNNKNWDGTSISKIQTTDLDVETIAITDVSSGCGVSMIRGDKLYYQISSDVQMNKFDLQEMTDVGVVNNLDYNYYAIAENPINGYLYTAIANFVTNSGVMIYDQEYNIINSFFADVASSKIVFDVRSELTSLDDNMHNQNFVTKTIDLLGRDDSKSNFKINLFDNGHVEKQYLINN